MKELPNLAGIATKDLVETKGGGSFSASYINWARTLNLLHQHAPGWQVEAVVAHDGGIVFHTAVGGYLMMRLVHSERGLRLPAVPQAIMDNRNNAIPSDKITARDVTDTHRRGACLVAAMHFGLAYELWAKDELESGFASEQIGSDVPHVTKSERIAVDLKKTKAKNATPDPNRPVGNVFKAVDKVKKASSHERAAAIRDSLFEQFKFTRKDRSEIDKAVKEKEGTGKESKDG